MLFLVHNVVYDFYVNIQIVVANFNSAFSVSVFQKVKYGFITAYF
ncbi:hypothetical protein [Helicobacter pylori]